MNEVLTWVAEAITKALLHLAQDIVEIRANEGINGSPNRCEEKAILPTSNNCGVVVRKLKAFAEFAIVTFEFFDKAFKVVFDLTRRRVA